MSYRISEDLMQRNRREHAVRCLWKRRIHGGVGRRTHNERINVARVVDFACFIRVEEDAIPAAQHGFIAESIRQADSGSKGFPGCRCRVGSSTVAIETIT